MSRELIALGTGVASFAGTVAFTTLTRDLVLSPIVVSLATGVLGLAVQKVYQDPAQNQVQTSSLKKQDYILIGGASFVGGLGGGVTVFTVAALVNGVMLGSMLGSCTGTMIGNLATLPFSFFSMLLGRRSFQIY